MLDSFQECQHDRQELRTRTFSNGTVHFAMQCVMCGMHIQSVKKNTLTWTQRHEAQSWDDDLQRQTYQERVDALKWQTEQKWQDRREEYAAYLQSDQWRRRRLIRLEFDNYKCQARLSECSGYANEVHHLHYRSIGNEPMFDVVSVCRSCHRQISEMEGRAVDRSVDVA